MSFAIADHSNPILQWYKPLPAPANVTRWELFDIIPGPDEIVDLGTFNSTADLLKGAPPNADRMQATCVQRKEPAPTRKDKLAALGKGLAVGALVGAGMVGFVAFGLPLAFNLLGAVANVVLWPAHGAAIPFGSLSLLAGGAGVGAAIGGFAKYQSAADPEIKTNGRLLEDTDSAGNMSLYFESIDPPVHVWNLGPRSSTPNYQI